MADYRLVIEIDLRSASLSRSEAIRKADDFISKLIHENGTAALVGRWTLDLPLKKD